MEQASNRPLSVHHDGPPPRRSAPSRRPSRSSMAPDTDIFAFLAKPAPTAHGPAWAGPCSKRWARRGGTRRWRGAGTPDQTGIGRAALACSVVSARGRRSGGSTEAARRKDGGSAAEGRRRRGGRTVAARRKDGGIALEGRGGAAEGRWWRDGRPVAARRTRGEGGWRRGGRSVAARWKDCGGAAEGRWQRDEVMASWKDSSGAAEGRKNGGGALEGQLWCVRRTVAAR